MKGAEAIVNALKNNGVEVTFGYPGGFVIPLFDEYLNHKDINNILVRHEQGAAHAAEGYAKASGKVGVCIATSGPGATNLVTGIMDAFMDNIPIVAIGGQVPINMIGKDAFQETDMIGITMPITKHNFQIRDSNKVTSTIDNAFKVASTGRPGPVYIDLPKNIQVNDVTNEEKNGFHILGYRISDNPDKKNIKKAVDAILKSERPMILAGQGVLIAEAAEELRELVDKTSIPVATTMQGKGVFDENNKLSLGIVGMHGNKAANYAQVYTDCLIAIGCRFSDRITGNLESYMKNATVIHIDIDPAEISKNVKAEISVIGDAKNVIKEIITELKDSKVKIHKEWVEKLAKLRDICDNCRLDSNGETIHPRMIIDTLNKTIKEDDIIVTGVGQHQMFAMHYLKRSKPRTFISSGGAGTMGFGLPAAIGVKVAKPDKDVYLIDGDGCFQMTIQELGTIQNLGIKLIIIIFNNNYLGMVRQWLEIFTEKRYSEVHLGDNPDFVKIGEAYGLNGINVSEPKELAEALKKAQKSDKTTIINVIVDQESNILPMLPPGGHVKQAFGGCMCNEGDWGL